MARQYDFQKIKAEADIVEIIGKHVRLDKRGSIFRGQCPFHSDSHASLEVIPNKKMWYCHPCGMGGDILDFFTHKGYSVKEALEIVAGTKDIPTIGSFDGPAKPKMQAPEWRVIPPPQTTPEFHHPIHGQPSIAWTYRAPDGSILGYTCRFDIGEDRKEVLPYYYCTDGQREDWRWKGPVKPKPLYGLDRLAAYPDATIVVVEGEKTCDALQAVLSPTSAKPVVVISWMGGANGIHNADWTPVYGRKIILWGDNDWEGVGAIIQIGHIISDHVPYLRSVLNPHDAPRGWDFADSGWDTEQTRQYVNSNLALLPPSETAPAWAEACEGYWVLRDPSGEPKRHLFLRDGRFQGRKWDVEIDSPLVAVQAPQPPQETPQAYPGNTTISVNFTPNEEEFDHRDFDGSFGDDDAPPPSHDRSAPFHILGFEKIDLGKVAYIFYDKAKRVILRKTTSELTKSAFLELADLAYWEENFPGSRSARIDEDAARNFIIRIASQRLFSVKLVRGRGAWLDNGRTVIHAGDRMIVEGQEMELGALDTSYIYEVAEPLRISLDAPLKTAEATQVLALIESLSWERKVNAVLLAGWCVIAPICGALKWRPHIWLTGGAGTGKSWIMRNIVREMLGETALQVQGDTTEAGLRQTLGMDAMPVVFDEAEPHDPEANRRIQSVLSLMRSASTSDSGEIIKGTAGHNAKTFRISSCFAMASISVAVDKKSDRSRVTILGLTNKHSQTLEELNKWYSEVVTKEFVQRLQARTLSMLPIIIHNSGIFAQAAAEVLGEQRIGDQLGPMLAGAYSLRKDGYVNYDKAKEWIQEQDWNEEKEQDASVDELALLQFIFNHQVRVSFTGGSADRTITELIDIALGRHDQLDQVSQDIARHALLRIGIRPELGTLATGMFIIVSNDHEYLKKMLRETPWAKNHNKILRRLPGAQKQGPTRFIGQAQSRGVLIPYEC